MLSMTEIQTFANQLLIAVPSMHDDNFARSVTLMCQHDGDGAMGLIINRTTDFNIGELFNQLQIPCNDLELTELPVLWGGPVQTDRGFVLHNDSRKWPSTLKIADGLSVTTSREILGAIAKGRGPEHFLVLLGYAGWTTDQFEGELADNSWLTVAADKDLLFGTPLESRWQAAASRIGVDLSRMTDYTGRA